MRKDRCLMLIVLSIVIVEILITGCTKKDNQANENLKIVFESSRNVPTGARYPQKYIEIYIMNPDGSNVKRITNNLYWEHKPQVSPDGNYILVTIHFSAENVEETDPGWELAIISFDGTIVRKLTDNDYFDGNARWSYDGKKIVYISDSNKRSAEDIQNGLLPQYDIYIMNADGTEKRRLTFGDDGEVNADPSFSRDGNIYYIHSENYSNNFDLWTMSENGSGKHIVFSHNGLIKAINDPVASPDGSSIIFEGRVSTDLNRPIFNLFTVFKSGNNLMRITQNDGESDIWPSYSPDGGFITYFTYEWESKGGHTEKIRVARKDGSEEREISTFPWESFPSWFEK